jgi:predicted O-methyltransferase YrrM
MGFLRLPRPIQFVIRYTAAAAGALYALTVGVATSRGRRTIAALAADFGFAGRRTPRLPQIGPDAITSDRTPVTMRAAAGTDGNVSHLELLVLNRLVRERAPSAIFEIGTFDGRTALNLAANAPAATVYTLDLPPAPRPALVVDRYDQQYMRDDVSGRLLLDSDVEPRVHRLRGDSATFDFSPYAADVVFVDGAHSYEYVVSDARAALGLLRNRRGAILFHDYTAWDGVTRALDELQASDPAFSDLRWVAGTTLAVLLRDGGDGADPSRTV